MPGVTITAVKSAQQTTTNTDSAGNYSLRLFGTGTYAVTPTKTGSTFTPATTNVGFLTTSQSSTVNFSTAGTAPTASTQAATNIDPIFATLNATVNPGDAATTVYFQYGTNTSYGSFSSTNSAGAGFVNTSVSILVTGLLNGVTYHFRVVATNRFGQVVGGDLSFQTPSGIPTVTTLAATLVSGSGAHMNGNDNPNGVETMAWFQWGTTTNYGNVTAPQDTGNGTGVIGFSQFLIGLVATNYHFRAVAATDASTNYGVDMIFSPTLFTSINSGLPVLGATANRHVWGDYDNDGILDLCLSGRVFRNSPSGFTNIYGNEGATSDWGDYDNDGKLDYMVDGVIYRNLGSTFTNLNPFPFLPYPYDILPVWADMNNDGKLDVVLEGTNGVTVLKNVNGTYVDMQLGILAGGYADGIAVGDLDGDGLLDIVVTGYTGNSVPVTQIWHNTETGFSNINASLPGVWNSYVALGDYDNDGKLDILLTGATGVDTNGRGTGLISQVWRNTGTGFSNINAGLPGVEYGSAAWGDYDNDGKLDILLTGATGTDLNGFPTGFLAQVWRNTGTGFSNINAGLPGIAQGTAAWGDYDNDGRLDILLSGIYNTNGNSFTEIYRNSTPFTNTPPTAPSGLTVTPSGASLTFSWNAATDAQSPAGGLTYNLRIGSTPGGTDIMGPMSSSSGFRQVVQAGNAGAKLSRTMTGLPFGQPLYWTVQAIDSSFAGSAFAPEQGFSQKVTITAPSGNVVPGDTNGDGMVDQNEFAAILPYLNGTGQVTAAELNLVLGDYFPYSPLLDMTNVAGLGGTNVTFALTNSFVEAFSVEYSTNLSDWIFLGPATPRYLFTDTNAPAVPQRFYRLRYP